MFRISVVRDLKGPRRGRRTTFSFSKEFFSGLAEGLTVTVGVFLNKRMSLIELPVMERGHLILPPASRFGRVGAFLSRKNTHSFKLLTSGTKRYPSPP